MKLCLCCTKSHKSGEEKQLLENYMKKIQPLGKKLGFSQCQWITLEQNPKRLRAKTPAYLMEKNNIVVTLDEKGPSPTSWEFSRLLSRWMEKKPPYITFLVGHDNGIPDFAKSYSSLELSLGSMTWPHKIAQILLTEQIYRAFTLLTGHPYHRE